MPRRKTEMDDEEGLSELIPPLTPESFVKRCVSLAYSLVERRLREGTASSQETTFFLKLGTEDSKLETERLKKENLLLEAKTEAIQASKMSDEATNRVLAAVTKYKGDDEDENE